MYSQTPPEGLLSKNRKFLSDREILVSFFGSQSCPVKKAEIITMNYQTAKDGRVRTHDGGKQKRLRNMVEVRTHITVEKGIPISRAAFNTAFKRELRLSSWNNSDARRHIYGKSSAIRECTVSQFGPCR
jgi:hypothetical protein